MNFEHIWTEYQAGIKAFLHSRVSNPDDVDDLLQDILMKTHQNISTLKSQDSAKAWIFQIANHAIIDFYRKRGQTTALNPDDLWYGENAPDTQHDLSQCILPFIKALPKDTAELLTAIEIHGQAQKEYAITHDIPYSTLKSRVQKGRRQLREMFENCCQFSRDRYGNIYESQPKSNHCKKC